MTFTRRYTYLCIFVGNQFTTSAPNVMSAPNNSNNELDDWPESREWYCTHCLGSDSMYAAPRIGFRYVDDVLRTSRESPDTILQKCNQLHPNLEFTIEFLDQERAIVFLDMKIRRKNNGLLVTEWY